MGRPLKKAFIGNTSTGGQQIQGYAWTAGDNQARLSYIVKQKTTNSYVMQSVNGTGVQGGGQVYLVNGSVTAAGQGNIKVLPYGDGGEGATATANLKVTAAGVTVNGTGSLGQNYVPGEVLHVVGGTYTGNQQANVQVTAVTWNIAAANNLGSGYAVDNVLEIGGAGYTTNVQIKVNSVNVAGAITGITILDGGVFTSSPLPSGPFAPTTSNTISGAGATFDVRFGVYSMDTVINGGDYTVLPSNPVSFTGSVGGTGARANLVYGVSTVKVTNGGTGYTESAPAVSFNPAGGATAHTTISGGAVTSVVVDSAGTGLTAIPSVYIVPAGTGYSAPGYAHKITDQIVYTFDGRQFNWLLEGQALPGPGWAHIKSD